MSKKKQKKDKRAYDRRHRTKGMRLSIGDKVQVLRTKDSSRKGGKMKLPWIPANSYYIVQHADNAKHIATLKDPSNGDILARKYPFEVIRLFSRKRKRNMKADNRSFKKNKKI